MNGLAAGTTALDLSSLTPTEWALADCTVDLDILYIGAHPDDEAWTLGAFGKWNEFEGQRVGVITVTRGEGGGNSIGIEEGPPLGLMRESEERTAVGYASIEHSFNLNAIDFYYTLSAPLSYDVRGGAEVLSRVIRVVRATRPDVIVTMNPLAVQGNHGNHQQATMFAVETYLLASREHVFPEHFDEGLSPFSLKRRLRFGSDGPSGNGPDAVAEGFEPVVARPATSSTAPGMATPPSGTASAGAQFAMTRSTPTAPRAGTRARSRRTIPSRSPSPVSPPRTSPAPLG